MPVFVHITSHRNVAAIRRSGIKTRQRFRSSDGVYAMPVTRNFYLSHQWIRELKRWRAGTVVGVYFRVPHEEPVLVGHYNTPHLEMTAAQAVKLMMGVEPNANAASRKRDKASKDVQRGTRSPTSPEGYEVVILRSIAAKEIIRVKDLPQVVGWRYMPGSNGTPPCTCLCCYGRGSFGVRKLLTRLEKAEAKGKPTKIVIAGRPDESYARVERLKAKRAARSKSAPAEKIEK